MARDRGSSDLPRQAIPRDLVNREITLEELIERYRQEHTGHEAVTFLGRPGPQECHCWYCDTARRLQAEVKQLRGK